MERLHYDRLTTRLAPQIARAEKVARDARGVGAELWEATAMFVQAGIHQIEELLANGIPEGYDAVALDGIGGFYYLLMKEAQAKLTGLDRFSFHHLMVQVLPYLQWYREHVDVPAMPNAERLTWMQTFYRVTYEAAGKRIFQISEGLGDMLMNTELRGLLTDDVRLPYESVYVCVPRSLGLKVYNEETGWHEVEGVYVAEDSTCPSELAVVPVPPGEPTTRAWRMMIVGKSKNPANDLDDAVFYYAVHLPDGKSLEDELRDVQRDRNTHEFSKIMAEEEDKLFRLVLNAMIYATWPDAEVEHVMMNKEARQLWSRIQKLPGKSKKKDRLKETLKKMDQQKVIVLGKSIVVDRSQAAEAQQGEGVGKKMNLRVRVKGHWRRYHVGQGRAETKKNWIQPFWRGPEDGMKIEPTTHVLKKDGQ